VRVELEKIEKSPSLRERAYRSIKHVILHDLAKGDVLVVEELATQLGISRTPVREALLALEQEGLARSVPYKGTFVAEPSAEEVNEIYQVREVLEPFAVRLATSEIPDHDLRRLRITFDSVQKAISDGDFDAHFQSDTDFHELIVQNAGNEVLRELIDNLADRVYRIRVSARKRSTHHLIQSFEEHRLVLDALIARDVSRAEFLMREHIRRAGKRIEEILA